MVFILKEKPFTIYIISGIPGRAGELYRALNSALNQDYSNYNIVVRMGYRNAKVESLANDKVTYTFFDGEKIGVGKKLGRNLSESLQYFKDYVCFMDDDDYFKSDKLRRINEEFENDCVYVHNSIIPVDETGREMAYSNERDDFNMSSISVKKEVIDKSLFHDLDSSLDTAIYLCAINNGNLCFIPDKLTFYTIHSSTTIGFLGNVEEWRERKLYSYSRIIQPAYEYLHDHFKGTRAEKYAKNLLYMNTLFIRLYGGNTGILKIGLGEVFRSVFFRQYFRYRDTFASRVILASLVSRKKVLKRLYHLDSRLVIEDANKKSKNDAAEIHKWN